MPRPRAWLFRRRVGVTQEQAAQQATDSDASLSIADGNSDARENLLFKSREELEFDCTDADAGGSQGVCDLSGFSAEICELQALESESSISSPRRSQSCFIVDDLAELQAILAGLPQHAVPQKGKQKTPRPGSAHGCGLTLSCIERVEAALSRARLDFPHRSELRRLVVVHATLDLVCLADHSESRLFIAARGTDRVMRGATLPRDLGNDTLIFLGFGPVRVNRTAIEYKTVCDRFPGYSSFGVGHSLGASVIEWLALWAEQSGRHAFQRIDLFNPGSSPLRHLRPARSRAVPLVCTEVHTHRVLGDVISRFHVPAGPKHLHPRRPELGAHSLGHFLPAADVAAAAAREAVAAIALRAVFVVVAAKIGTAELCSRAAHRATRALQHVKLAEAAAEADERGVRHRRRRQFGGNVVRQRQQGHWRPWKREREDRGTLQ
mmetsp:Transcript_30851/g.67490  ORF Transcript_30851/g.67490 Transcript_30851/m.67490 type:complete len:436 (-) Transcript_30851:33-1340(-)